MNSAPTALQVVAPDGLPEFHAGDNLAAAISGALARVAWPDGSSGVSDGDIVVVTSKVVSKVEDRLIDAPDREDAITAETVRTVATRGRTRIVETRHGLVLAAAGVDASNVPVARVALLPLDPDESARLLRADLLDRFGLTAFCSSAASSRRRFSLLGESVRGTSTCTCTCRSPIPRPRTSGMPRPRTRTPAPPCVPRALCKGLGPSSVGTSTVAPRAAWENVIGTSQ